MRYFKIIIILLLTISCESNHVFKDLADKEKVFLALDKYGLDCIPKEIGELKNVKELEVFIDSIDGWTVYPPLSAIDQRIDSPPFRTVPDELLNLNELKKLTLFGLDIQTLPENLDKLKELEYLDLSMNKLTIRNEIYKLKKLPKLKYIQLFGNRINMLDIENWRKENLDIEINYGEE